MATITKLTQLSGGVQRQVDLSANTLSVLDIQIGATTLTQTILDKLIALQDGSDFSDGTNAHTHDGRYYTETEIGSTSSGQGASLVGIEDLSSYYTGFNVETALDELTLQIGGITSSSFTFAEQNVVANNDPLYEALNKLDLKWGDLASTANAEGASLVGVEDFGGYWTNFNVEGVLIEIATQIGGITSSSFTFTEQNVVSNNMPVYVALDFLDRKWGDLESIVVGEGASLVGVHDAGDLYTSLTVEGALQEVGQDAADLRTLSGTADTETDLGTFTGDTIADSSTIKAALQALETKAEANTDLINGLEWQDSVVSAGTLDPTALSPSTGDRYLINGTGAGDWAGQDNKIAEWDGAAWQYTDPSTGMFVSADDESTLLYYYGGASWSTKAFESTTASGLLTKTGFDITIDTSAHKNIIAYDGSGQAVAVTMSGEATISNVGAGLGVIILDNDAVIAKTLTGYTAGAGTVSSADSIISAIEKLDGNIQALDAADITYTPAVLTDWDGDADPGEIDDALDQLAARTTVLEDADTGAITESGLTLGGPSNMSIGELYALRAGRPGEAETAGHMYQVDVDTSTTDNNFYPVGVVLATGELIGGSIVNPMYKVGTMTVTGHGFTIGQPVYVSPFTPGRLTSTAPTGADEAVVRVGIVRDANTIDIQIQVMGVN